MDALAKASKITGTIGLPRKAAPPSPAPAPAPKPEPKPALKPPSKSAPKPPMCDSHALPGEVDLAAELAPEHRVRAPKLTAPTAVALVMELIEATRGVAETPIDTRGLRLALAMAEALPAHTPASLTWALRTFIDKTTERELAATARELLGAITQATTQARLGRFTPMLRGALEVIEQRRAAPKEKEVESAS